MNKLGDLLGSQSKQSRSLLEEKEAPTADVRDLISSKVASSSARDDMEVRKEDDTTGLVDLRAVQEPKSAYFP